MKISTKYYLYKNIARKKGIYGNEKKINISEENMYDISDHVSRGFS